MKITEWPINPIISPRCNNVFLQSNAEKKNVRKQNAIWAPYGIPGGFYWENPKLRRKMPGYHLTTIYPISNWGGSAAPDPPNKSASGLQKVGLRPPKLVGIPMGIPIGIPMGVPMGIPMGIPMLIPTSIPMGIPMCIPMCIPMGIPMCTMATAAAATMTVAATMTAVAKQSRQSEGDPDLEQSRRSEGDPDLEQSHNFP